jgi:hypothetical protein
MDHRIEARIAALETEISTLKALIAEGTGASPPTSDRRGMVKLMAVSAVGAVTGAALLGAQPAAAANTQPIIIGFADNEGSLPTGLTCPDNTAFISKSVASYGIEADGGAGNALFTALGPSPILSRGDAGALWVDGSGDWWAATRTDLNDGFWRKVAGPNTAGQLHLLPSPIRVYDSRPGAEPTAVEPKTKTQINTAVTIDPTENSSGVPAEANGVLITLTITGPASAGFAKAYPDGVPIPATSSINFAAGQTIATTTVVGCGAGSRFQVLANSVTDFLIDVIGYYQ